jgi:aminoglycoside phosphotransferase (APT) family kinase protein
MHNVRGTGEMSDTPVDLALLAEWMNHHGLGGGPIEQTELLAGGTQNILLRFGRADRTYVLRRPPQHKRANSDETMRREARVLAALAGTDVPHPRLIAAEPDIGALGAAFYLMESVEGFNATVWMPEPHRSDAGVQHAMGLAMADAIAAVGRIDPAEVGLGDLGRADGWLERQVARWHTQLDGYRDLEGYTGPDIANLGTVAGWLDAHRPAEMHVGLIHGDFHFANALIAPDGPRIAAIVDWELATIGHPLLDLGHLLCTWPGATASSLVVEAGGLPSPDELIARYAAHTELPFDDLLWFRVLACYRLGIILEGSHARACAGMATIEIGDQLHTYTVNLFDLAMSLIG